MVCLTHLSRLLLVVAVSATAMLLAPSGAQAHAGHQHGPVKVERAVSTSPTSSFVQSGHELRIEASGTESAVWIAASSEPEGKATTTSCSSGCCHSAGQGCCAAALPGFDEVAFMRAGPERFLTHFRWGPGISPGVLSEPPRYLV
jgi:hypothetical protein